MCGKDELMHDVREAEQEPDIFDVIEHLFTHHAPTEVQKGHYEAIREAGKILARVIDSSVASGPDKTAAIRKVREAVMTANAGIATNNAAAKYR